MADEVVSLELLSEQLDAMVRDEASLLVGVKKEVDKLCITLKRFLYALGEFSPRQLKFESYNLKDLAYNVEDILDELTYTSMLKGDEDEDDDFNKVCSWLLFPCLCFKQVVLCHDIGHKIRETTKRLNETSIQMSAFKFLETNKVDQSMQHKMRMLRETFILIDESEIFGRDVVKDEILNELVSETSKEKRPLSVVSIVGMGGLGKTTLAQLVYTDETIMKHFDKRLWVYVSEDYDVNEIFAKIIRSMGESTDGILDLDNLQQRLNAIAGENRFLLVLDDVWDGIRILWKRLKVALKDAALGSRIVITTRSRTVADVMETTHLHHLGFLSDSDCWKLFTSRAFRGWNEEEWPPELTEVGNQIVHRCKGVPLAIKAVGNLLCSKRRKVEWEMVLKSKTWEWDNSYEGVDILQSLLLSYSNLPIHLRQCFSFCSLFPKDYELKKDELVKLWMAHGIIKSERREIEEIGEMYFDDLLNCSLFQDAEKDCDGNIVLCKMHGLVHDLATWVTAGDYRIMEIENPNLRFVNSHHLSLLVNYDVSTIPFPLCSAEHLRTLLLFGSSTMSIKVVPHFLFNHLKVVRALDLSRTEIENLPSSLGKLKHLRYLDLSELNITELPESVSGLYYLQTLKLNYCKRLCLLPSGISKMVKLRHLEIEGTDDLKFLPSGLGMLSSLRTLRKFPVGDENNSGCKIGELKNLNLLKGILQIQNLEKVINPVEAREAELDKKCHLQGLSLECNDKTEEEWGMLGEGEMEKMERVFEGLRPPQSNVKFLSIQNYGGSKFPRWLEDAEFSSLECLKLYGAHKIKVVGSVFYGKGKAFPKLKQLHFKSMSNWEEWKLTEEDGEVMPSLDELYITNCNKLKALPNCLPNTLKRVEIEDCIQIIWAPDESLPLLEDLSLRGDLRGIWAPDKPLPYLPALKKLFIWGTSIESLPSDGWGLLESLNTLHISSCDRLASLPNGLGQLKALQSLNISHCERLFSLPEGLVQLVSLVELRIDGCPGLVQVPHLMLLDQPQKDSISIVSC